MGGELLRKTVSVGKKVVEWGKMDFSALHKYENVKQ